MKNIITLTAALLLYISATSQNLQCYTDGAIPLSDWYSGSEFDFTDVDEIRVTVGISGPVSYVGPTASLNLTDLYTNHAANHAWPDGHLSIFLKYYKCVAGNCSIGIWNDWQTSVYIYGNDHMVISQDEFCQTDEVALTSITTPGTGVYSTNLDFTIDGSYILDASTGTPGAHQIYHTTISPLITCSISQTYNVVRHPDTEVSWTSSLGPYTDISPQVDLALSASSSTGDPFSFFGAGVLSFQYFDPSLAGDGTWDVVVESNGVGGCHERDTIQVVVNHDPGVIPGPSIDKGPINPVTNNFSGSFLCDGDGYNMSVISPNPSYTYHWYISNSVGGLDTLGIASNMLVTIPDNPTLEEMYIYVATINNIGVEGPKKSFTAITHPVVSADAYDDTICYNDLLFEIMPLDVTGYSSAILDSLAPSGLIDTARFRAARKFVWRDEFGTLIDTNYNFSFTFTGTKVVKVTRQLIDEVPWSYDYSLDIASGLLGCQCVGSEDTVWVVQQPKPGFTFAGASTVVPGTPIEFYNQSLYFDSIDWDFDDGTPFFHDDTLWHYFNDQGNHDLTLTAYDTYGCSADSVMVSGVHVQVWLSTSEEENISSVEAYPNPFNDHLNVELSALENETALIQLFDLTGKMIASEDWIINQGKNQYELQELSFLPAGQYLLRVTTESTTAILNLIKQ